MSLTRGGFYMFINYSDQALNNWVCLFEDAEYEERKEVFLMLIKHFGEKKVDWAVGCSMNLFLRGIVDEFHDLDIIADIDSIPTIKSIMEELGAVLKDTGGNGFCESDMYLHYQLGRVDVDIISGFRVMTFGTSYYYPFNKVEVDTLRMEIVGIEVPLISLEAMYILYYMMEGWQRKRQFKRKLIEEYFRYNKPIHSEVFQNALDKNNLPGQIRWAVKMQLVGNF